MGITGCSVGGYMDDTKFNKPMPWIGIYIAAASLACLIAVTVDLIHGIRGRKFWFPCRYFCLNATSLTIIGVALKLSVDLNTPVPQRHDQLAKLSSSALICTIIGNSMPSLGVTDNKETMMNVVAMGILVITMIVNICIQFVTGVIYVFWVEHAIIMLLMLILLMTMFSSAVAIPKMKHYLELKYEMNEEALKESANQVEEAKAEANNQVINSLREELMRFWMMAHTSSPQFVLGRSVTCTASGAFCLLSTMALAEAMLRSYLMPWSFRFCTGHSDYKWSTIMILIVQVAAVAIGTISPAFRWFTAISYRCPILRHRSTKKKLQVEGYWTARLILMKETPLGFRIRNRQYRKLAHDAKVILFKFLIKLQIGIVLTCKATQCVSVSLMCFVLAGCNFFRKLKSKFSHSVSSISSGTESRTNAKFDLRRFVLHLEGEEELVGVMMKDNRDATNHWFQAGEKKEPKHVIELIEKCSILEGFKGVVAFDSDQVPHLHCAEPPNSWSLPLVTLASIIVAIPNIDRCKVRNLIDALNEGLPYVKFIENNLDKEGKLIKVRTAAEIIWLGVDLYQKWHDVDLYKLSLQSESPKETLEKLSEAAKIRYHKFKAKYNHICIRVSPSSWPIKILSSNSMYRISQATLLNHECMKDHSSERLFEALKGMICDILGACLTNLPHVISTKCLNSAIEEREDSVRYSVHVLGKTKKIIEMLEKRAFPVLDFGKGTNIEDWRLMHKQNKFLPFDPCSLENDTLKAPEKSSDCRLNID
ncbi:uncharacterized protein LOC107485851 [Arachis duranensis]|uniref:Uncharacterized protein LOC107485851 n=3 Tax=Arachis TaxID=3817 RepID=A0A6P4D3L6_ARADU|nr:uncharacterized protein LOC107485851 [Arachis duranensis]